MASILLALMLLALTCADVNVAPDIADSNSMPDIDVVDKESLAGSFKDCGQKIGNHPCNFKLEDQKGDSWQLYNHHGSIIVLDFSTMWCGVCIHAATKINDLLADYPNEKIIWATILLQNTHGIMPNDAQAKEWAKVFDLEQPVLAADVAMIKLVAENLYNVTKLPTMVVIDRELVIQYVMEGWNEGRMRIYLNSIISGDI